MVGSGNWQSCDGGVAFFVPGENRAPRSVEAPTQVDNLMRRMSISRESQGHANDQSSPAVRQPLASLPLNIVPRYRVDSPSTICDDTTAMLYRPPSTPSSANSAWYEQLEQHSQYVNNSIQTILASPNSPSTGSGYDSDRMDFLIDDPETPCPSRSAQYSIDPNRKPKQKRDSKIRQPIFRQSAVSTKQPLQLSEAQQALKDLKDLEYARRHFWTDKQRYDLAILFRFFQGDAVDLAKVFNKMHGLNLDAKKQVKPQVKYVWDNAEALLFCSKIITWPLDDPYKEFAADRSAIAEAASLLGVKLKRRREESGLSSGSAKSARSRYTRRRFKLLMRKACFVSDRPPNPKPYQSTSQWKLGGIAIPTHGEEELEDNLDSDEEPDSTPKETTPQVAGTPAHRPQQPTHLGFRVWDRDSRTIFDPERGFISDLHSIWNGRLLPAPQLDTIDGRNCHLLLTNIHLSKKGNASAYVSVATSLVQVLSYATNMVDPQIAIIDLSAKSLQAPWKQLKASDILRDLKAIGQAGWARYRGTAEIMIFGSIPMNAIIHHGSLTDLAATVTAKPAGKLLLDPNDFKPEQRVSQLTDALKAKNIKLTHDVARLIATFAKGMSLHSPRAELDHISEMVQVMVDGWSMSGLPDDIHARSSIAQAFALALASRNLLLQDCMQAFLTGYERGVHNLTYYQHRRLPSYRRRRS